MKADMDVCVSSNIDSPYGILDERRRNMELRSTSTVTSAVSALCVLASAAEWVKYCGAAINKSFDCRSYLTQTERHNLSGAKCRAIISPTPRFQLLAWAARVNLDRAQGRSRGPLYGIPIILKDVFAIDATIGMPTTAGSCAIFDACPSENAAIVEDLLRQGLIIIGKANMTANFLGRTKWSAVCGMCQPAYIPTGYKLGDNPRGESARSFFLELAVSPCEFTRISLGSETTSSLVTPAPTSSLYALKLTPSSTSLNGLFHSTLSFDTVGAVGKTSLDAALACDALLSNEKSDVPPLASVARLAKPHDLPVGFVYIEKWRLPSQKQTQDQVSLEQSLKRYGVNVIDVYTTPPEEYMIGDTNVDDMMGNITLRQSNNEIERYLKALEYSKVLTVKEIIQFIDYHPIVELGDVNDRLISLAKNSRPDEEMQGSLQHCKRWAATEGIDGIMSEHGVDVVVCSSDSFFAGISVGVCYPMGCVPFGYVQSTNEEVRLVKFMVVWEKVRPARRSPDLEAYALARQNL
ncbi:amidase signature domain-containing protein [Xylariaceae sp. FL0255]|nr:amidase signature domain-containing protein [Xylariaceae sp. FL0255]